MLKFVVIFGSFETISTAYSNYPITLTLFNSKEPLTSLTKLNNCISDIRVWMIKNKLKINDSKTEFIIFRSPLLKTDLSGV